MATSDEQYLADLYNRFREQVMNGDTTDYYDKDELLDIYDYAQDEGDVMTQLYVFLVASRLYPDADSFLGERMGFFVSYIDNRAGADMLSRKGRADSPLWDILALGIQNYPDGDPSDQLARIIASHRNLDSEAVIKLVDMLRDLNRLPLLFANLNALKEIADDPRGLLYEAAQTAADSGRFPAEARDIAEELTGAEPFNLDNWVLLARAELALDHANEAVTAAEYALALDPGYAPALLVRALAQVTMPETRLPAIADLERLMGDDPSDTAALKALVEGLKAEGENERAINWLMRFIALDPKTNVYAASDIFDLEPEGELFAKACEAVYDALDRDENRWASLAAALESKERPFMAIRLLRYHHDHFKPLESAAEYLMSLYYMNRDYAGAIEIFGSCCQRHTDARVAEEEGSDNAPQVPQLSLTAFLLFAAASLMTGDYTNAAEVARLVLKNPPPPAGIDDRVRLQGIFAVARRIARYAAEPAAIPAAPDFDVLTDGL